MNITWAPPENGMDMLKNITIAPGQPLGFEWAIPLPPSTTHGVQLLESPASLAGCNLSGGVVLPNTTYLDRFDQNHEFVTWNSSVEGVFAFACFGETTSGGTVIRHCADLHLRVFVNVERQNDKWSSTQESHALEIGLGVGLGVLFLVMVVVVTFIILKLRYRFIHKRPTLVPNLREPGTLARAGARRIALVCRVSENVPIGVGAVNAATLGVPEADGHL